MITAVLQGQPVYTGTWIFISYPPRVCVKQKGWTHAEFLEGKTGGGSERKTKTAFTDQTHGRTNRRGGARGGGRRRVRRYPHAAGGDPGRGEQPHGGDPGGSHSPAHYASGARPGFAGGVDGGSDLAGARVFEMKNARGKSKRTARSPRDCPSNPPG